MQPHTLRTIFFDLTRKDVSLLQNIHSKQDKISEMAALLSTFLHPAPDRNFQRATSSLNLCRFKHSRLDFSWLLLQLISIFFLKFWDVSSFLCWPADLSSANLYHINSQLGPTLNFCTTKLWHRQCISALQKEQGFYYLKHGHRCFGSTF